MLPNAIEPSKALKISSPPMNEGTYSAKIMDENYFVKNVTAKKDNRPLQIVQMKIAVDNSSTFLATVLNYEDHLAKKLGDVITVRVFMKDGYKNAEV